MNQESYASLTPAQKAAFDKLTGKALGLRAAKIFDDWEQAAFKLAKESNRIELIQLSPEVRQTLFNAAKPAVDKTLTEFEKGGIPDIRAAYVAMQAARKSGDAEEAVLSMGQDAGLIHDIPPAAEIVARIAGDAERILRERLPALVKH